VALHRGNAKRLYMDKKNTELREVIGRVLVIEKTRERRYSAATLSDLYALTCLKTPAGVAVSGSLGYKCMQCPSP